MLDRLTVLCWHSIAGTHASPWTAQAGQDGFDEQLRWLDRYVNVVGLDDGLERLRRGNLGPRAVALTFDDGYRDNLEVAAPLLERHGMTATVFAVTGYLSASASPWWEQLAWALQRSTVGELDWRGDRLDCSPAGWKDTFRALSASLKEETNRVRVRKVDELVQRLQPSGEFPHEELMLDWDGARSLMERGLSIGAHTRSHAILARESASDQLADLRACRTELIERLGLEDPVLAYPNGDISDYDANSVSAARRAGFSWAMRGVDGWNSRRTPPWELNRLFVRPDAGRRGLARVLARYLRERPDR